ncbi:hypothetical protein ACLKA6_007568 [Drosophila palustris]
MDEDKPIILETSETSQWRHVATADNPADHLSRGLSVNKLSSSELWWHGPQWLQAAESEWPTTEIDIGSTTEVSNEMKSVSSNRVSIEQMPHVNLLERYSSYTHMLRVIAYVQRFVRNCKVLRCERRTEGLSVDELSHSLRSVTRMVQLECFTADWKALQLGRALPKDSTLLSLNPYFDVDAQVIRLGGRLRDALLPMTEKHPYILTYKHHFTTLVIQHAHASTLHGGAALTLNYVRKLFWIINGRNAVRVLSVTGAAEEVMKPESRKLDLMKTGAIIKGGRMFELQRN